MQALIILRDFGSRLEDVGLERIADLVEKTDGGPARTGPEAMRAILRELPWKKSYNAPSAQELLGHWREYFQTGARGTQEMRSTLGTLQSSKAALGVVTSGAGAGPQQKKLTKSAFARIWTWHSQAGPAHISRSLAADMEGVWLRTHAKPWSEPPLKPSYTISNLRKLLGMR